MTYWTLCVSFCHMADATTLATYLTSAREAVEAEDTAALAKYIALAKIVIAELPNVGADGVTASYSNSIAALESAYAHLVRAQSPIVARAVTFCEPI